MKKWFTWRPPMTVLVYSGWSKEPIHEIGVDMADVPQVTVVCTQGTCKQQGKEVSVDSGVILANGAVLATYGTYNCTVCGGPMVLVH